MPEIDFEARQEWLRAWLAEQPEAAVLCAVDAAGGLLGFVGIAPSTGYMEQLAVHPRTFSRGVATALLDAAKSLCPGGITLRVNQDNPRAIAFYRRAGFVINGEAVNPGGVRRIYEMAWGGAGQSTAPV